MAKLKKISIRKVLKNKNFLIFFCIIANNKAKVARKKKKKKISKFVNKCYSTHRCEQ